VAFFGERELEAIKRLFQALKKTNKTRGVIDQDTFSHALHSPSVDPDLATRLFRALERSATGAINLNELVSGLSAACGDIYHEKLSLVIAMYATRPGYTDRGDLEALVVRLGHDASLSTDILPRGGCDSIASDALGEWIGAHKALLDVTKVTDVIQQATRIELGIRPASPADEGTTIQAVQGPRSTHLDPSQPGPIGTAWHLVSKKWWETWEEWSLPVTLGGDGPLEDRPLDADIERLELEVAKGRRRTRSVKGQAEEFKVKSASSGPPPIDNKPLLDRGSLKVDLTHGTDYILLPPRAWKAVHSWYGGGPLLECWVVCGEGGKPELELYPPLLTISKATPSGEISRWPAPISLVCSKSDTISKLRHTACTRLGIGQEGDPEVAARTKLWASRADSVGHRSAIVDGEGGSGWQELTTGRPGEAEACLGTQTLAQAGITNGSWQIVADTNRPRPQTAGAEPRTPREVEHPQHRVGHRVGGPGLPLGLNNIGNTCYMNSAMQVIARGTKYRHYY